MFRPLVEQSVSFEFYESSDIIATAQEATGAILLRNEGDLPGSVAFDKPLAEVVKLLSQESISRPLSNQAAAPPNRPSGMAIRIIRA